MLRRSGLALRWVLLLCFFGFIRAAEAAGGPENVLLVVNAEDETSRMVANWYQRLRQIPDGNVLFLPGIPRRHTLTWEECRELVLKPLVKAVEDRKLGPQIDYIVYSSGFPTRVTIMEHFEKLSAIVEKENPGSKARLGDVFGAGASLTSITWSLGQALGEDPGYMSMTANHYYRKTVEEAQQLVFGCEAQAQFEESGKALSRREYDRVIELLEPLAEAHPVQMFVHYRLALAWGGKGDAEKTAKFLIQAARAGWCYRKQTRESPHLKSVIDAPLVAGLIERLPDEPFEFLPTMGFSSRFRWGPGGTINSTPDQGFSYLLCTMLGTNWDHGNSEQEIIDSLRASAAADGTRPDGIFFFCNTSDVRAKTRVPAFKAAIDRLEGLGLRAEEVLTAMPQGKKVAGLVMGESDFNWKLARCEIQPGAICESLTSFGGDFTNPGQTKLTEFIRYGAAASSGTITEPLAIPNKFPHPLMHVHYARGCTLAESYYQSVAGPFQLLIVGDALCRPWARPPVIQASGLEANATVKGNIKLTVTVAEGSPPVGGLEVYLDGQLAVRHPGLQEIQFDASRMADGHHELRIVAIDTTSIQTRGRVVIPFEVDNAGRRVEVACAQPEIEVDGKFSFQVSSNVGNAVELLHAGELIGKLDQAAGEIQVEAVRIGRGPATIVAVARDDKSRAVSSQPLAITVRGPLRQEPVSVGRQ